MLSLVKMLLVLKSVFRGLYCSEMRFSLHLHSMIVHMYQQNTPYQIDGNVANHCAVLDTHGITDETSLSPSVEEIFSLISECIISNYNVYIPSMIVRAFTACIMLISGIDNNKIKYFHD